jgi:ABC-type glycerol-3-phosphate transport system substrate-binding protein
MKFRGGIKRKIIVAILALSISFTSGCGVLQNGIAASDPVTLKFGYSEGAADYKTIAKEFEKEHPNIQIELVSLERNALYGSQSQDLDAFRWDVSNFSEQIMSKLLSLDDFLTSGKINSNDFYPGTIEALQYQGKQIGLPAGVNIYTAYANTQTFTRMGVDLPSNKNWTIDDFLAAASSVNNQQGDLKDDDFSFGYCSNADSFDPLVFTYLFGGAIFDQLPSPTKATLDTPENESALEWFANLKNEYGVLSDPVVISRGLGSRNVRLAITAKKCGLWLGTYSDRFQDTWGKWDTEPTMLPLPKGKAEFNVGLLDGYFILNTTKHPSETFEWISYLSQQPGSEGLMMPVLLSRIKSDAYARSVGADVAAVARKQSDHLILLTPQLGDLRVLSQIMSSYGRAVQYVLDGEMDAGTALQQAQDLTGDVLK